MFKTAISKYAKDLTISVTGMLFVDLILSVLELLLIYLTGIMVLRLVPDSGGMAARALNYASMGMALIYLASAFVTARWRYYNLVISQVEHPPGPAATAIDTSPGEGL
jgi:hypothetical protein